MAIKKTTKKTSSTQSEGRRSLADLWDDTDASEASNTLPSGAHEVRLNKIELKNDPKKGEAVFVEYECIEGEYEGKKGRQMYKMRDVDGNKGPGIAYLMRDLALLGYDEVPGNKLKKILAEISEEQPMVVVTAKEAGQYTNIYVQGLVEGVGEGNDDADEDEDEEDEDEEEAAPVKKGKKKAVVEEEEEDDSDSDEDGEEEEEEEEEEEAPKKKGKAKPAAYVPSVGDDVKWTDEEGDELSGSITKINTKKGTAVVTDEDDDTHTVELSDLEEA